MTENSALEYARQQSMQTKPSVPHQSTHADGPQSSYQYGKVMDSINKEVYRKGLGDVGLTKLQAQIGEMKSREGTADRSSSTDLRNRDRM